MKYATAAALLPLASATNIDARQASTEIKYEISDFAAACMANNNYCFYDLGIVTSNNPEFKVSCSASGTSDDGELPAVRDTKCGTYTVSITKSDNGDLVLAVDSHVYSPEHMSLTGTYTIPGDELTTTTSDGSPVQSYTGDSDFTIDVKDASSAPSSAPGTTAANPTASSVASVSSSSSSGSPTASSESSTTGTTTSSSLNPTGTNSATRKSAFNAVLFAGSFMVCTW